MSRDKHFFIPHSTLVPAEPLRSVLDRISNVASSIPDEPTEVDVEKFRVLIEAARALDYAKIKLWCVVKHYHDRNQKTGAWPPAVWCAFLTEAQALTFREAIAAHYGAEAKKHGWRLDRWTVERRLTHAHEIIHPDLLAAEYVAGLR